MEREDGVVVGFRSMSDKSLSHSVSTPRVPACRLTTLWQGTETGESPKRIALAMEQWAISPRSCRRSLIRRSELSF
jgi:hypothetical protein